MLVDQSMFKNYSHIEICCEMDDLYEVPCGFVFGVTIVLVFVMLCSAQIVHIKHCFRTYGVFSTQCWFLS